MHESTTQPVQAMLPCQAPSVKSENSTNDGTSQHSSRRELDNLSQHSTQGSFQRKQSVANRAELEITGYLSSGACGTVHKANFRGIPVAVKFLKEGRGPGSAMYKDFMHEVMIRQDLTHPNIVGLICANTNESPPFVIFERMDGGSLEAYLVKKCSGKRQWIPPRLQAWGWITDTLKGLTYLHTCHLKIIHRDLKPANLMLSADFKTLKITDFGLSKAMNDNRGPPKRHMTGGTGTLRYMAPEVYLKDNSYTNKVDIYSLAMIMYHLVVGEVAFLEAVNMDEVARKVAHEGLRPSLKGARWVEICPLIEKAWSVNPNDRPSAFEMLTSMNNLGGLEDATSTGFVSRLFQCFAG